MIGLTTKIFFGGNKINHVTNRKLQLMLDRFHLGKLISSSKTTEGVSGQTLFVTTTMGLYVLKGKPLFMGQFIEEKFFIDNLNERTELLLPYPYMVDETIDIFGWSYALMPRLNGFNLIDIQDKLNLTDQLIIAETLANTLLEMHSWKVHAFGEYDPIYDTICPFEDSFQSWIYKEIRYWLEDDKKYSVVSHKDVEWVEEILDNAKIIFLNLTSPSFVMNDFKPGNFLLDSVDDNWRISGIFDFTTGYFGDPIADLSRMTIYYLDNGEEVLALRFLSTYYEGLKDKENFIERFRVHMLHQLILNWGCAHAINQVTWDKNISFLDWAKRYTEIVAQIFIFTNNTSFH